MTSAPRLICGSPSQLFPWVGCAGLVAGPSVADLTPEELRAKLLEPQRDLQRFFPKVRLRDSSAWRWPGYRGGPGGPSVLSSVSLPHAATTLASKGLGAANRLIVACDTLKLRATSTCASPFASLCMASRR